MSVGDIIAEPIMLHGLASGIERTKRVEKLLSVVGLGPTMLDAIPMNFRAVSDKG